MEQKQFSFLSPKQVAEYLGYKTPWFALKVLREAGVPITKLGGRKILVSKSDVDKFIKSKSEVMTESGKKRPALEVEQEKKLEELRRRKYG